MLVEEGHHLQGMEARPPQPVEDLERAAGVAFVDGAGEEVGRDPAGLAEVRLDVVDVDPGPLAVGGPEHVEQRRDPAGVVAEPVGHPAGGGGRVATPAREVGRQRAPVRSGRCGPPVRGRP